MSANEQEFVIIDKTKVSVGDIQTAAKSAWADIRISGTAANKRALENGIDISALPEQLAQELSIKQAGAGVTGVDLLIVALGPVAWDLWKHVLLPQIRERWGDNAIKAKNAATKAAAKKSSPK